MNHIFNYNLHPYIEFFNNQLLIILVLGSLLILLFIKVFATRDSSTWKPEFSTKDVFVHLDYRELGAILLISAGAALIYSAYLWIELKKYINGMQDIDRMQIPILLSKKYSEISRWIVITVICSSFGGYSLKYRPSPRSNWVKARKIIAYLIIISTYGGFAHLSVTSETLIQFGYEIPIVAGIFIGNIIPALIAWLLLKNYKNERYIPYCESDTYNIENSYIPAKTTISNKTKKTRKRDIVIICIAYEFITIISAAITISTLAILQASDPYNYYDISIPIIISVIAIVLPLLICLPIHLTRHDTAAKITNLFKNKKRAIAYYIGYEILLFLICFTIIILQLTHCISIELIIPIILFFALSILPLGIYWMIRLFKESKE